MKRGIVALAALVGVAAPLAMRGARAQTATTPEPAASASSSASSSPSSSASAPKKEEPVEIEVIDLNPEEQRDPQRYAVGAQFGGMWMTNKGSGAGTAALDFALVASFGLGAGGARVPFTLEAWAAAAIVIPPFSFEPSQETSPNRFTELGVRLVYRRSEYGPANWFSLGGGLVWTGTRQSVAPESDPACSTNRQAAIAAGIDCPIRGDISPGALVEAGFGVYEWASRRLRVGFGVRVPGQISSHPGIGGIVFAYGSVGLRP